MNKLFSQKWNNEKEVITGKDNVFLNQLIKSLDKIKEVKEYGGVKSLKFYSYDDNEARVEIRTTLNRVFTCSGYAPTNI